MPQLSLYVTQEQFLKIENVQKNEEKLFRATFNAEKAKSYTISIVENNE